MTDEKHITEEIMPKILKSSKDMTDEERQILKQRVQKYVNVARAMIYKK